MAGFEYDLEAAAKLAEVLEKYELKFPKSTVNKLAKYCDLLWFWNTKLNLTRHTDFEKFVSRDLVDSIAVAEFLEPNERILDVGTGGGVPGVILAIIRPDLQVELCDSTGKKANAVAEIVRSLKLEVPVWNAKAETLMQSRRYTTLVIRAVAKMSKLLEIFAPCWQSFERLILVKGPNWVAERGESRHLGQMNNLALRVLKSYPIPDQPETADQIESVVLQVCQKSKFSNIADQIRTSLETKPQVKEKKEDRKPRVRFPFRKKRDR